MFLLNLAWLNVHLTCPLGIAGVLSSEDCSVGSQPWTTQMLPIRSHSG